MPWEVTERFIRSGHGDPNRFDPKSMRTIVISKSRGIMAIIGCPRGQFQNGRCRVGTETQSYLFEKKKGWTKAKAQAWMKKNKPKKKKEKFSNPFAKLMESYQSEVKSALEKMDSGFWYTKPGQRVQPETPAKEKGSRPVKAEEVPEKAYCVKCKKKVTIKNPKKGSKGGRHMVTGVCPECGTRVTQFY